MQDKCRAKAALCMKTVFILSVFTNSSFVIYFSRTIPYTLGLLRANKTTSS